MCAWAAGLLVLVLGEWPVALHAEHANRHAAMRVCGAQQHRFRFLSQRSLPLLGPCIMHMRGVHAACA